MATSTIFANIKVPADRAEAFLDAIEKSERNAPPLEEPEGVLLTDPQEIHAILNKVSIK